MKGLLFDESLSIKVVNDYSLLLVEKTGFKKEYT